METDNKEYDILTPLLNISGSSNKGKILHPAEPEPVIIVHRGMSKLGLFTITGMAIVLFQVRYILRFRTYICSLNIF